MCVIKDGQLRLSQYFTKLQRYMLVFLVFAHFLCVVQAFDCLVILEDVEVTYLHWQHLERCLSEVSGESLTKTTYENIWRLVKSAFDGIENIPAEVYAKLGYVLTAIPLNELYNVSMERVETVEAFGAITKSFDQTGFKVEQIQLIAQKTRHEWLGKSPYTYSEYDLMSMGEILCHLNVTDIANIHAEAFRYAVEWIGNIRNCPQAALAALAQLATSEAAFGPTNKWSKLQVSLIGNIVNGLAASEMASIDKDKLHLNRFYRENYAETNKIVSVVNQVNATNNNKSENKSSNKKT